MVSFTAEPTPALANGNDPMTAIGAAAGERFPWQVDGEYLGEIDALDIAYVPDAISLVLPVS